MGMDSILASTKKIAQLGEEYDVFDPEIIMYINSTFLVLKQLGVGPSKGFVISDANAMWSDFLPDDEILREHTKAYMGAKVKLKFDPPLSSAALTALTEIIKEYEWRLNIDVETE